MKRSNLVFFIEQIVDLSIANTSLCDERRKNETRIKELEAKLLTSETESLQKDALIYDLQKTDGNETAKLYQKELVKAEKRVKELEDVHTRSSSSKLSMVEEIKREQQEQIFREEADELEQMHNMDDEYPPEQSEAELMSYCEDRIQEFIKNNLFEAKDINHVIDIKFIPKCS